MLPRRLRRRGRYCISHLQQAGGNYLLTQPRDVQAAILLSKLNP